jgi:CheY-like chemotaxis protein
MVAASRIILLGQNLFFQGRIETVAEPLGYSVRQAHTEADFWDNYAEGETELVLVDLEGDADTWSSVLTGLGQGEAADLRIVAFGPHEDLASMEKAAALGAQQTLNKGRFSATLGEIVGGGG